MNRKLTNEIIRYCKETLDQDITDDPELVDFVGHLNEKILSTYFGWDQTQGQEGGYWTQQINFKTRNTGQALVDRITTGTKKKILDVGCGDNEFKQFFGKQLVGIDPYNDRADIKIGLENYIAPEEYDIVLALGSVNFGDERVIFEQVSRVVDYAKPGGMIVWRCNPGITHDHPKAKWIDFFEWDEDKIRDFAERNDCDVEVVGWDHQTEDTIRWGNRLYSIWHKR